MNDKGHKTDAPAKTPQSTNDLTHAAPEDHHNRDIYLARYSEHNSRLQTWIGGYGAGLASLLVYQFRTAIGDTRELWKAKGLNAEPAMNSILAGMHEDLSLSLRFVAVAIALQVILLGLNKATQFAQAHMSDQRKEWTGWDKFSVWFSDQYWFDALCDMASVGLLATATVWGIKALGITP